MEKTDLLSVYREMIEEGLSRLLPEPAENDPAAQVRRAMRYSVFAGGKRIRPVLCLAFCQLCGEEPGKALNFACALELLHSYSLIHDDLPCMDDDELRRGQPTNHLVFGEGMAVLAGDALLTKAFELVLACEDREKAAEAGLILAVDAGDRGMVGGQCIDLMSEEQELDEDALLRMDLGKTVALIDAACRMGCVAAGAPQELKDKAGAYARYLGLAFQIRDDILDVAGQAEKLGKNTGMDAARGKKNFVSFYGEDQAQAMVELYSRQAAESLEGFPGDAGFLQDLAALLGKRDA